MPFREKTAWAMIVILTLAGLFYYQKIIAISLTAGETAPPIVPLVIAYVVFIIIASIIVMPIVAAISGKEANAPADEREEMILAKAGNWSGYALGFAAVAGLFNYAWTQDGNLLFHTIFAGLMASQIAEYGFQVWFYRRGV
ncbi:MAG: hypothetical protein MRY64_04480 [Hyphomonadaceae bacterium]|nr:hypothetical protein [Hyphomonadaceae bacterium]